MKQLSSDIFHFSFLFAIIYNCRRAIQHFFCSFKYLACMCRLRQVLHSFAGCVNEKSVALAEMLCFVRFSLQCKLAKRGETFSHHRQLTVRAAAASRWRKSFLSRRSPSFYRGTSFVCGSHSSHIWPWSEHYLSHIFVLSLARRSFDECLFINLSSSYSLRQT